MSWLNPSVNRRHLLGEGSLISSISAPTSGTAGTGRSFLGLNRCPTKVMPSTPLLLAQHIYFWLPQFQEHAFFIARELKPSPIKDGFLGNLRAWTHVFQKRIPFLPVLENLMAQQKALVATILTGTSLVGNIPIALVQHMIEEEDYFLKVLNNCISPEEERAFWVKESAQHTRLAGQMIDPQNPYSIQVSNETLDVSATLNRLAGEEKYQNANVEVELQKALKGAKDLAKSNHEHKLHLLIQPDMLQHEIREAEQAKFRLSLLKNMD